MDWAGDDGFNDRENREERMLELPGIANSWTPSDSVKYREKWATEQIARAIVSCL